MPTINSVDAWDGKDGQVSRDLFYDLTDTNTHDELTK